jgi:hypothetical protein
LPSRFFQASHDCFSSFTYCSLSAASSAGYSAAVSSAARRRIEKSVAKEMVRIMKRSLIEKAAQETGHKADESCYSSDYRAPSTHMYG